MRPSASATTILPQKSSTDPSSCVRASSVCFCDSDEIQDVPTELGDKLIANLRGSVIAEIEHRMGVKVDGVNIQLSAQRASTPAAGSGEPRRPSLV
jgi:hypothetical protein